MSATGSPDGAPDGKWNNPDVRGAVFAIHGRLCAYCQRLASDSRGDVEHFRPKAVYPWLIYDFTNYLLGCRVCNSNRKSKRFPLAHRAKHVAFNKRMAADDQFLRHALGREKRLLLDPVDDPVDDWVDIDFDKPLCPITSTPGVNKDRRVMEMVTETISFFGLNTIPELIIDRFKHVNEALKVLNAWKDGNRSKGDELRALANRYKPHGWAVRRMATALAPALQLTNPEEDLESLVEENLDLLDIEDLILAEAVSSRDRDMVSQRREEACWTLAVLWKDPPAASPNAVEGWLARRNRRDEIDAFRQRLNA